MTFAQYAGLASAIFGVIGTIVLYFSSYSMEPLQGGTFGSDDLTEYNKSIKRKNVKRLKSQRIGLFFLCLSFVVQVFLVLGKLGV